MQTNHIKVLLIDSLIAKGIEEETSTRIIESAMDLGAYQYKLDNPPPEPSETMVPEVTGQRETLNLVLEAHGANKIQVIKIIRSHTGLGLKEAKAAAETKGWTFNGFANTIKEFKKELLAAGATVRVVNP